MPYETSERGSGIEGKSMIDKTFPEQRGPAPPDQCLPQQHARHHHLREKTLQHILGLMGETYFEFDLKGKLTVFNAFFRDLHTRSAQELKQLDYRTFMTTEDADKVFRIFNEVYRTGKPSEIYEFDIIAADQARVTFANVLALLRDPAGQAIGFCGVARDITKKRNTEKSLAESEKKHRGIIEQMTEGYYETDIEGNITFFNAALVRTLGYEPDELMGLGYRDYLTSRSVEKADQIFTEVYHTGVTFNNFECEFIKKNGEEHIHEISVSLLRDTSGTPVGFFGIARDRTEIRRMEKQLRESEKSHRQVLAIAPYSITITRLSDFRYVQVNEAFCSRSGYTREEALYRTPWELNLFQISSTMLSGFLRTLAADGKIDDLQIRFRSKAGDIKESLLSCRPIHFKGEDCLLIIAKDITSLKNAQRALAESEQRYRNILENMEEGYYEVTFDGEFIFCNKAMAKIIGYPPEKMVGLNRAAFTLPNEMKRIDKIYAHVAQTGIPTKVLNYTIMREDGSQGVIEASASVLKDRNEKPIGFYGIARDVTERKMAEKELTRYKEQLEQMVRERTHELELAQHELVKREKLAVLGQLTATVSHELRNPLGVIRSSNFYLQRKVKPADPKIDKHFRRIEAQVALCDSIVGDLLEYTRGRNVAMVNEDIHSWLVQLLDQQQEQGIDIDRKLAPALPAVPHDPEKLRRVIINIMDNAIQAVKARQDREPRRQTAESPCIRISTAADQQHVIVVIEDDGIGMDSQTLQRAFEPLFTTRARGTGIGLAIVQKIVLEHGGRIDLESSPQKGTKAIIHLPLARSLP
jgi:PAS domain S-box-containing protein